MHSRKGRVVFEERSGSAGSLGLDAGETSGDTDQGWRLQGVNGAGFSSNEPGGNLLSLGKEVCSGVGGHYASNTRRPFGKVQHLDLDGRGWVVKQTRISLRWDFEGDCHERNKLHVLNIIDLEFCVSYSTKGAATKIDG